MIWTAERNMDQGALVASMYEQAASVPCERKAVMAGGLRGADTAGALTQAGIDASRYLTISIDAILVEMAERGLIPHVDGLSPLEAADLVHVEAQFLAKRLGLRALADGRNVIWDISMASQHAVESWIAAHRQGWLHHPTRSSSSSASRNQCAVPTPCTAAGTTTTAGAVATAGGTSPPRRSGRWPSPPSRHRAAHPRLKVSPPARPEECLVTRPDDEVTGHDPLLPGR